MANVDRTEFERDKRHQLYKEYLRIIRKFHPPIFVMENVKGMLSAKLGGRLIFDQIRQDLSRPAPDLAYEIRSFTVEGGDGLLPRDFVIKSEEFGVPQARHRVILLGVRSDFAGRTHSALERLPLATVGSVISQLPELRGRLSTGDSHRAWLSTLEATLPATKAWAGMQRKEVLVLMKEGIRAARTNLDIGSAFVKDGTSRKLKTPLDEWLSDERIGGWISHESRSHMPSDLMRYFFAACYALEMGFSPRLREFPERLLPDHRNVDRMCTRDAGGANMPPFEDRFKVQVSAGPSSTVVSHIAKDGHYYIHPDPSQGRSLTVREAARLQTFPDNYLFEGNRTEQFTQVGNAVPPYLARQLAEAVYGLIDFVSAKRNAKYPSATKRRPHQLSLQVD
jgi:DNA (cytosine-5)-methyltransferase 1